MRATIHSTGTKNRASFAEHFADSPVKGNATPVAGEIAEHWRLVDQIYETGQSTRAWPVLLDSLFTSFGLFDRHEKIDTGAVSSSLNFLLPHMERALQLNKHMEGNSRNSSNGVYLDLPYPLVVANNKLEVCLSNLSGPLFFPPQSGIKIEQGCIDITIPAIAELVAGLLGGKTEITAGKPVVPLHRDADSNNCLVAIPLPRLSGRPVIAFAWLDPIGHGRLSAEHFQQLYQLTSAESRVLDSVLRGDDTNRISEKLSIATDTIRTHLKNIYRKSSTRRKEELIQAVMCGPVFLSRFSAPHREMFVDTEIARQRRKRSTKLSDGRSLGFAEFGALNGTPILLMHNMIGSRLQIPVNENNLIEQDIRLIIPDRQGVGLSDTPARKSIRESCQDIAELIDYLGISRCHLIGSSLGAVHGLALAHYVPEKIERLAMVSCLPEIVEPKVARELLPSTRHIFTLVRHAPLAVDFLLKIMIRKGPEAYLDRLVCDLPEIDQHLYQDPAFHRAMIGAFTETLRQGTSSLLHDVSLMARPWGFHPESIPVPVHCWHGACDTTAPFGVVKSYAARLPDCTNYFLEDETHWLLFRQWNTIVANLLR